MPKRKNEEDHHRTFKDDAGHTHVQDSESPSDTEDKQVPVTAAPVAQQQQRKKFVRNPFAGNRNNGAGAGPAASEFSFGSSMPTTGSGSGSGPGSGFVFGSSGPAAPSFGLAMGSSSTNAGSSFGAASQAPPHSFVGPATAGGSLQFAADIIKGSVGKSSTSTTSKGSTNPPAFSFGNGSSGPLTNVSRSPPAPSKVQATDDQHSKMLKLNEDLEEHVSHIRANDPCADLTIVYQKYIEYVKEIKGGSDLRSGPIQSAASPGNKSPASGGAAPIPPPPPAPPASTFAFGAPTSKVSSSSSKSSINASSGADETVPKPPTVLTPAFSFGAPSSSAAPVTSPASNSTAQQPSFAGTGFSFGAPSLAPSTAETTATTTSALPTFTFGKVTSSTSTTQAATPSFSFGSATGSTTAPTFSPFGAGTSTASAPTTGGFTFGSTSTAFGSNLAPAGGATNPAPAGDAAGAEDGDDDDAQPPVPTGPAAVESSALLDGESMDFEHKFRVRVCQPDQDPAKTRVSEWPVRGVGTVSLIRNETTPSKHRLFIRTGTTVDGVVANTLLGAVMATAVKIKNKTHAKVAVFGADKDKYKDKPMMLFLSVDEEGGTGEKAAEFVDKVKACKVECK